MKLPPDISLDEASRLIEVRRRVEDGIMRARGREPMRPAAWRACRRLAVFYGADRAEAMVRNVAGQLIALAQQQEPGEKPAFNRHSLDGVIEQMARLSRRFGFTADQIQRWAIRKVDFMFALPVALEDKRG